ncbi:MAG: hypothetical protein WCP98_14655 [Actinomycetes bacterium]
MGFLAAAHDNVAADNVMRRRVFCTRGDRIVAEARRAVVISRGASMPPQKARITVPNGNLHREMRALAKAGAETPARGPRGADSATCGIAAGSG